MHLITAKSRSCLRWVHAVDLAVSGWWRLILAKSWDKKGTKASCNAKMGENTVWMYVDVDPVQSRITLVMLCRVGGVMWVGDIWPWLAQQVYVWSGWWVTGKLVLRDELGLFPLIKKHLWTYHGKSIDPTRLSRLRQTKLDCVSELLEHQVTQNRIPQKIYHLLNLR